MIIWDCDPSLSDDSEIELFVARELDTTNNLGNLYNSQGKLDEAEKMYQRAAKKGKGMGPRSHISADHGQQLGSSLQIPGQAE
jgi:tetratricopeptide (TPR) repeat protein